MTGATATAIGVGVAGSLASTGINAAIGGGGGGGGGGGLSIAQQQYIYHGPHPSTTPLQGEQAPKPTVMQAPKAGVAKVDTARQTPTQAEGTRYASRDFQGVWADRLSRYLDYNTRNLG